MINQRLVTGFRLKLRLIKLIFPPSKARVSRSIRAYNRMGIAANKFYEGAKYD